MPEVSRQHAVLRPVEDAVEVRDLDSKNGVYVNERRVSAATLALGDEVRFGPVALRLEAIDERDVELALPLAAATAARALRSPTSATRTWESDAPVEWLPLLERAGPLPAPGPGGPGRGPDLARGGGRAAGLRGGRACATTRS